ncbi:tubulin binding cofactor C-domain-containing protein [Mycena pura]|uniref:Tubulin binding cofactor C-domain-containing protein n=1 Tax=Mycena pura TaxID=153505 RepID=A0AAD6VLS3_9AGAR|nr:tubulin binding cofactor C-domain-containing protein [Mycena pura]
MDSDTKTWSFSQEFSVQFQASRTDLESRVAALRSSTITPAPDAIQSLSQDLAKLTKTLADATGSLPNYAQRQYELQLKGLDKSLEELRSLIPKTKFAFKRRLPMQSSAPTSASPASAAVPAASSPPPYMSASTNLILSSHSLRYLSKNSLPSAPHVSDLTISDLNKCVVNLLPDTGGEAAEGSSSMELSGLHIRNLTDTILLLPNTQGSVLLHDLHRCIVVVGCHQFRIHTSTSVDVYLSIPSTAVIEHCSRIRFSSRSRMLSQETSGSESALPDGLSVQDFSHIKSAPSPNWSVLPREAFVDKWPVGTITSERELEEQLDTLLP